MSAILLALVASLGWGTADFLAGLKSRSNPALVVVLVAQATGLALLGAVVALHGLAPPGGVELAASVAAGTLGFLGAGAFYRAMAIGTMSVVAPIVACGAAVPVAVGAARGGAPSALQWVGMVLAVAGSAMASRERSGSPPARWRLSIGLAVFASVVLGGYLALLGRGAEHDALWAVLVARAVSVVLFGAVVLVTRPVIRRAALPGLVGLGTIDTTGNAAFALATTRGLLGVAAVVSSTFPVVTVALAHRHLGERLARIQRIGVVLALAGVVALASPG